MLIIFGRPFLATVGIIIDVTNGKLKFQIGKEEVEFNLMVKNPYFTDKVYYLDIIDE